MAALLPRQGAPELLATATDLSKILGEVRTTLTDPAQQQHYDISTDVAQLSSSTTTSARLHCERTHFGGGPPGDGEPAADLRGTYGIDKPAPQRYHLSQIRKME